MSFVWAVEHGLMQASKRMHRAMGITGPQHLVLRIVGRNPGISATRLANILHLHPSTLTGVIRRLEEPALVERVRSPEDARSTQLTLTSRGRTMEEARAGTVHACVTAALLGVSDQHLAIAELVLARIAKELLAYDPQRALSSKGRE